MHNGSADLTTVTELNVDENAWGWWGSGSGGDQQGMANVDVTSETPPVGEGGYNLSGGAGGNGEARALVANTTDGSYVDVSGDYMTFATGSKTSNYNEAKTNFSGTQRENYEGNNQSSSTAFSIDNTFGATGSAFANTTWQ